MTQRFLCPRIPAVLPNNRLIKSRILTLRASPQGGPGHHMTDGTPPDGSPRPAALFAAMGLFVLLGLPLVYVVWETINEALTGNTAAVRLELFLPALVGLAVVLVVFMRVLRRWFGDL